MHWIEKLKTNSHFWLMYSFVIIAFIAVSNPQINLKLFYWLNTHWGISSYFWAALTNMADGHYMIGIFSFLFLIPRICLVWALSLLFSSLVVSALKYSIQLPRPVDVIEAYNQIGPQFTGIPAFPSGHTASAFFAAGFIGRVFGHRVLLTMFVFALMIGLSRIKVGVHWPRDVFAAGLVAFPLGYYFGSLRKFVNNYVCYGLFGFIALFIMFSEVAHSHVHQALLFQPWIIVFWMALIIWHRFKYPTWYIANR